MYVFESAEDDIDVLPMTTEIPTFDPTLVIVQAPTYETRFQNFLTSAAKPIYQQRSTCPTPQRLDRTLLGASP